MLECSAKQSRAMRFGLENGFVQALDNAPQGTRIDLHDHLPLSTTPAAGDRGRLLCQQLVFVLVDCLCVQVQFDRNQGRHLFVQTSASDPCL